MVPGDYGGGSRDPFVEMEQERLQIIAACRLQSGIAWWMHFARVCSRYFFVCFTVERHRALNPTFQTTIADSPPGGSRILMSCVPPKKVRSAVLGDLADEFEEIRADRGVFNARAWYRQQALRTTASFAWEWILKRTVGAL